MIAIVILGILFVFVGFYFVRFWREHRISVQNDFLHREAIYAMDFIINGRMKEKKEDQGRFFRYDGIISSSNVEILDQEVKIDEGSGSEIRLYDPNYDPDDPNDNVNNLLGRIFTGLTGPLNNIPSLLFDEDQVNNGNEYRILPQGSSETGIQNPYELGISFTEDDNIPFKIEIKLWLDQKTYDDRPLHVEMHSAVHLRN